MRTKSKKPYGNRPGRKKRQARGGYNFPTPALLINHMGIVEISRAMTGRWPHPGFKEG